MQATGRSLKEALIFDAVTPTASIISTSLRQALQELRGNKLRSALSLLGITIGIFCIIAVLTVLDSMQHNIRKEVATLGSDVLYIGRWPWMDDGGEYKWWEYWRRPSMTVREVRAIQRDVPDAGLVTLALSTPNNTLRRQDNEIQGITAYATLAGFDQIQNIEMGRGRYLSSSELDGGTTVAVLGQAVYESLFPGDIDPTGKTVAFQGRKFMIAGVMKKTGQNVAGFDFDNCIIYPYFAANLDISSLNYDPMLLVKARPGVPIEDLKVEVEGALRRVRKLRPGAENNFAFNQLSQVSARLDAMFTVINGVGWLIGGFSLVVGLFGIANIMFVTVKERTRFIGLKKAVGARPKVILTEFLTEAVVLCCIGGLIGIGCVLILSLILTHLADFPVTLSAKNFTIGVGISTIVGLLAGIIPAYRASRLDPVVAIRSN
jgi:putative ABC transport system permease protein